MAWYSPTRFRTQGVLIGLASLSITMLAFMLVQDAWRSTRNTLTGDARQQCTAAAEELQEQFSDRESLAGSGPQATRFEAQDVSLQGLSAAVLRSYEGMEGGFLLGPEYRMAGHHGGSFNISDTEDLENEGRLVLDVARQTTATGMMAASTAEDGNDLLVGCAMTTRSRQAVGWVLKRLSNANNSAVQQRRWWLAGLVLSAVFGLAMILLINVHLRHGVAALNSGLGLLENDFHYRLPPIRGEFGAVAEAINRMADRRSSLESTLRRQDRLAALGRVVSGVAHEIRNPLNSLRLTLELLDRRIRKGARAGEEVSQATHEVDRLDQILARLLAFGRPGFRDRRIQDVRPLIERAVRVVDDQSKRKRVAIDIDAAQEPLRADMDALAIEQILINLLMNAIDATANDSTVIVRASAESQELRIEVTDQGPGIRPDVREQIFNPYFTTKENGTGLGLAVSREIACHHGGSLDFASDDRGTTFILSLPPRRGSE